MTTLQTLSAPNDAAPIKFDLWVPSSNGTVYATFTSEEEATSLTNRINQLFPPHENLAVLDLNPGTDKYFVMIDKNTVTEECFQKLPGLKKLIGCYSQNPAITPWTDEETEEKNSRLSVECTEKMMRKLSKTYNSAQKHIDEKTHETVDFSVPAAPRKCNTGFIKTNYHQTVSLRCNDEASACLFPCGGASTQGNKQAHMEDVTFVTVIESICVNGPKYFPLYAIFDGHGGTNCSKFLKDNLEKYFQYQLYKIYKLPEDQRELALYNMFKVCGVDLTRKFLNENEVSIMGSTMVFMIVIEGNLWVVNVGDSRAVLSVDGDAIALSEDADLAYEKYQNGALKRGANVVYYNDVHRVNGVAMGRAVGHPEYEGINPRSSIICINRAKLDKYGQQHILIASDGFWDVSTSKEAALLIYQLSNEGLTCEWIAQELVQRAFNVGSPDNISALVIELPGANVT